MKNVQENAAPSDARSLALAVERALGWRDGKRDAELDSLLETAMSVLAGTATVQDATRLDWLESEVRHYGDGCTEPREAYVGFNWQQSKGCEVFPGVRAAIDAAMKAQAGDAEVQP